MRKTKTEAIGGYRYTVTQLGFSDGKKVYRRILNLVGGAAEGFEGDGGGAMKAIGKIVQGLSDADLDFLCTTYAPMTTVSGGEFKGSPNLDSIIEEHFAGRMVDMTKWLMLCIKNDFSDFLAVLGTGLAEKSAPATESASKFPEGVTGIVGVSVPANG